MFELNNEKVKIASINARAEMHGEDRRPAFDLGLEVSCDHFKFQPQNGGTVNVLFRVIAHPETADVGRLCELIQQSIEMDVTPPEPETLQELFGEDKKAA